MQPDLADLDERPRRESRPVAALGLIVSVDFNGIMAWPCIPAPRQALLVVESALPMGQ